MKKLLVMAALGLVGCGGDEGDCYDTVRAGGKEHCVPDPSSDKMMCVYSPAPSGLGARCDSIRDICPETNLLLTITSSGGDVLAVCECEKPGFAACDGTHHDL